MSGICGIFHFDGAPVEEETLNAMAETASYRGPDGRETWVGGAVGLAHLALHATDHEERQPLASPNGRFWLVADARLDNRDELLELLADDAWSAVPGDGELILAAYRRWGRGCPERLLGDFAFALWDGTRQRLFCARDPLGIKPFHYACPGQGFCFASEARQLFCHRAVPGDFDEAALARFLCGLAARPWETPWRHVRALPPAHRLLVERGAIQLERYWDIDPERQITYRREEDYAAHLGEVLGRAVAARLRTPGAAVGIALSGGLDSGSIAALARREPAAPPLVAGSLVFEEFPDCDERRYFEPLARELDIDVVHVVAERYRLLPVESHGMDPECPVTSHDGAFHELLNGLKSRGARVLLTGNGGDETVAGSRWAHVDSLRRGRLGAFAEVGRQARAGGWRRGWMLARHGLSAFLPGDLGGLGPRRKRRLPAWISPSLIRRTGPITGAPRTKIHFREGSRQAMYDNLVGHASHGAAIYWYDRLAARVGLEARFPFLDRRVIETTLAFPPTRVYRLDGSKPLLRRALAGILPDVVRCRSGKARLGSFLEAELRHRAAVGMESPLAQPVLEELDLVSGAALRAALSSFRRRGGARGWGLLYPLALELWLRGQPGAREREMTR